MYLAIFLVDFAVFRVFLGISRDFAEIPEFRGSATARNIRSPDISKIIAKFESDNIFSEQRYSSTKFRKFTDVCMAGCKFVPPPIQKSVNF